MECLCFDLPLLLEAVNDIFVTPSNLMRQTLQNHSVIHPPPCQTHHLPYLDSTVFPPGLQPQYPEGLRDDHPLLTVVWRRNALKKLQTLERGSTPGSFVGYHATDGAEKDFGRSPVVERAGLLGVDNVALVEEVVVAELRGSRCCLDLEKIDTSSYLVAEETARDVDLLAPHDYDLLAGEDLLGDD